MTPVSLYFMLITANADIAQYAEQAGVNRIFIDMEVLGRVFVAISAAMDYGQAKTPASSQK